MITLGDMMAFKSEAQREKFKTLVREGKISQQVFNEWESKSPKNLPERAPSRVSATRGTRRTTKVQK